MLIHSEIKQKNKPRLFTAGFRLAALLSIALFLFIGLFVSQVFAVSVTGIWTNKGDFVNNATTTNTPTTLDSLIAEGAYSWSDSQLQLNYTPQAQITTLLNASTLRSVYFVNANTGYGVGYSGKIVKTTDAGATWSYLTSGTTGNLYSTYFTDANTGYAVGASGLILKTTDGGSSWNSLTSGIVSSLFGVYFTDANTGYATGSSGVILKTTDAGANWSTLTTGATSSFYSAYFTDANTGYAVGSSGKIIKTTDAGANWSSLTSGITSALNSTYFTDANTGYAVGSSGKILKTTDAGTNWSSLTSGVTGSLLSIYFTDANTGYVVGTSGKILKTTDAGTTWNSLATNTTNVLYSIYFTDANTGYAAGVSGIVLKTTDAGTAWNPTAPSAGHLFASHFIDVNNGYAVGSGGKIIKTNDAGATWIDLSTANTNYLYSVYFIDANIGWVVGASGTILKTTDGGLTWDAQNSGTTASLKDIYFFDANNGVAVGAYGTILRTTNGGVNWAAGTSNATSDLNSVNFNHGSGIGYAVGVGGTILKSSDAGFSWTNLNNAPIATDFNDVHMFNNSYNQYAYIAGNNSIFKTSNYGTTWDIVTSPPANNYMSVYFSDFSNGFVLGANGNEAYRTIDGGQSWSTISLPDSNYLSGSYSLNANTAIVVGGSLSDMGLVIKVNSTYLGSGTLGEVGSPPAGLRVQTADGASVKWTSLSLAAALEDNATPIDTSNYKIQIQVKPTGNSDWSGNWYSVDDGAASSLAQDTWYTMDMGQSLTNSILLDPDLPFADKLEVKLRLTSIDGQHSPILKSLTAYSVSPLQSPNPADFKYFRTDGLTEITTGVTDENSAIVKLLNLNVDNYGLSDTASVNAEIEYWASNLPDWTSAPVTYDSGAGVAQASVPLDPYYVYSFRVRVKDVSNTGQVRYSDWQEFGDTLYSVPEVPVAPAMGTPQALSANSIRWNFSDQLANETGFNLHDAAESVKGTAGADATYIDENGLAPNTEYTRHVHSFNSNGASGPSASAVETTLAQPPSAPAVATDSTIVDKIGVSWPPAASPADHDHYRVYKDGAAGAGTLVYEATANAFFDDVIDLDSHTYYIYTVDSKGRNSSSFISDVGTAKMSTAKVTTWTNKGDFENNASTTGTATTMKKIGLSGIAAGDDSSATILSPDYKKTMTITASGNSINPGFSLAVEPDGTLWSTGSNWYGQLGLGDTVDRDLFTPTGLTGVSAVSARSYSSTAASSLALKSDGSVWSVGSNYYGQLGLGDTTSRTSFTQTNLTSGVTAIAAGSGFALALKSNGSLWVTGYNNYGQLGLGDTTSRTSFTQTNLTSGVTAIAAGGMFSLVLKSDGTVWATGYNGTGALGIGTSANGSYKTDFTQAKDSSGGFLTGATSISGGSNHSLAVKSDGSLWSTGLNVSPVTPNTGGQLGLGDTVNRNSFTKTDLTDVVAASGGAWYSMALKSDGTVWVAGSDEPPMGLGSGSVIHSRFITNGLTGVEGIEAEVMHSLALKYDGTLWGTGSDTFGALSIAGSDLTKTSFTQTSIDAVKHLQSTYSTPGTISGLKINAGDGIKAKWSNINWNSAALPANTLIKFRVRTSNDNSTWSSWSSYFTQSAAGSTSGTGDISSATSSQWLEAEATLESTDGATTPTLNDVTVDYDVIYPPSTNSEKIFKNDGVTEITGGTTDERGAKLRLNNLSVDGNGLSDTASINAQFQYKRGASGTWTDAPVATYDSVNQKSETAITGLMPGSPYYFRSRIIDTSNTGQIRSSAWTQFSSPLDIQSSGAVTAPTMKAATALSTSAIRWNFTDNANNEEGFILEQILGVDHQIISQIATLDLSYIDETGLSPNTTYTRHVHSYNADAYSAGSASVSKTTPSDKPTFPVATDGTLNASRINVSWTASLTADHYHVYRDGLPGVGTLVHDSAATSFTDTVGDGNVHTYNIYSANSANENSLDFISDTGYTAAAPSAPTIGTPTILSDTSIRWSFTDTALYEEGFKLHDSSHVVKASSATPNLTYLDETGLEPNTQYTRHVHAYNSSGDSPASANAIKRTLSTAPTSATASQGTLDNQIKIEWPSSTSASHYHVYKGGPAGTGELLPYDNSSVASYTDTVTDDNPKTYYIYSVNADNVNSAGYASATGYRKIYLSASPLKIYGDNDAYATGSAKYLTEDYLNTSYSYLGNGQAKSYLLFNTSGLNKVDIASATLNLSRHPTRSSSQYYTTDLYHSLPMNPVVDSASTLFNTGVLNRDGQPSTSYSMSYLANLDVYGDLDGKFPIDVATYLKQDVDAGKFYNYYQIYDIYLYTHARPQDSGGANFASNDYADINYRPYVEIVYRPKAPSLNSVSSAATAQLKVKFSDNSINEDDFHIYAGTSANPTTGVATVASTTKANTGNVYEKDVVLNTGTRYYVRVTAHDHASDNHSSYSNEISDWTAPNAPLAPIVSVIGTDKQKVSIDTNDGNPATTVYAIYNSTLGGYMQVDGSLGSYPYFMTNNDWTFMNLESTNLDPDTVYSYQIFAKSDSSAMASVAGVLSAPIRTLPSKPVAASAIGEEDGLGGYKVKVRWQSGGAQTNYKLFSSSNNYAASIYEGAVAQFEETGLDPDTTYTYRIYAVNGDGVDNPDYVTAVSDKAILSLMSPTIMSFTADADDQLSTLFMDNSITEDDFHFYLGTASPATTSEGTPLPTTGKEATGNTYNKSFGYLAPNTRYFLRIRAHDHLSDQSSVYSPEAVIYTKAQTPPSPTIENLGDGKYNITINKGNNPPNTTYAIYGNELGGYLQTNGTFGSSPVFKTPAQWGNPVTVSGLDANATYTFKDKARNGDGIETDFSSGSSTTPPVKPQMLLPSSITSSSITWNWRDNSTNETKFYLHNENEVEIAQLSANKTTYTENNLQPGTLYTRHVHSYNSAGGISAPSAEVSAKTALLGPTQLKVEVEPAPSTKANISWEKPASWNPVSYKVLRSTSRITVSNKDNAQVVGSPTGTNYTDTGNGNEVFFYQVFAKNGSGEESELATDIISEVAHISNPKPHGNYTLETTACASCHRGHTGVAKRLIAKNGEQICFTCHDGTGSVYNIAATWQNGDQSPKAAHAQKLTAPSTTDVKCVNCHNPHGTDKPWALKTDPPDLCFGCHEQPISMNGWNIKEQFSLTSKHNVNDQSLADGFGSGSDGALVVDGATNPSSNPYIINTDKNYTSVTVQNGGVVSTSAYNGTGGGQVKISATGTVTIDAGSSINVDAKGYGGGAGGVDGAGGDGAGPGGGGGSSGISRWATMGPGAGGAGFYQTGATAWVRYNGWEHVEQSNGFGGSAYKDDPDVTTAVLGSGGGGSASYNSTVGSNGGSGGGSVVIAAKEILVNGNISAKGQNGTNGVFNATGGSGGGSGGTIKLKSYKMTVNKGNISVAGGSGGTSYYSAGYMDSRGGDGSAGYIKYEYAYDDPARTATKLKCTNCHGPHTAQPEIGKVLSDPFNTNELWLGSKVDFCLKCHNKDNQPQQSWMSSAFVPYTIAFPDMTNYPYFPGYDKSAFKEGGHYSQGIECTKCHMPHGSNNPRLTAFDYDSSEASNTKEEELCLKCHGPAGTESYKNFNEVLNKSSKHPIKDRKNAHSDIEGNENLGGSRHAECYDCHNPHENSPTPAKTSQLAPKAYGAIKGAIGVEVFNGAAGQPLSFSPIKVDYEYQLCFKCHSSNVDLPPNKPSRAADDPTIYGPVKEMINEQDKAMEFNTNNPSYHPVESYGKNLGIKDESFVEGTPWNPTSADDANYNTGSPKVYCTDCHGNGTSSGEGAPKGPHGSDYEPILKGDLGSNAGGGGGTAFCTRCHNSSTYNSGGYGTVTGSRFSHKMGNCLYCHTAHGSPTNKHLINSKVIDYRHYEPGQTDSATGHYFPDGGGVITPKPATCLFLCHGSNYFPRIYDHAYK